ncbi:MAG: TonB-dependent receptor domain-containing protein [Bryobacteraceae bacterium]
MSRICRIAAILLLGYLSAQAQDSSGSITGTVKDPSGAVIGDAKVRVNNPDTGFAREGRTNESGLYRFAFLPIGSSYTVRVEKEGFKSQTQTKIQIEILQVRTVDFSLEVGQVSDSVTVETSAPQLESETSSAGETIKQEQVLNLPLGARSYMQLAFLTPMAIPASNDFRSTEINRESPMPSAAGQRPEQNNYQMDGIDNRESGRNGLALNTSIEAISEFRVQTGLAPAEFGRGGGVIINVVTRSGANTLHGSLYEFLRNNKMDSRPYFSSQKAPLKRNQFGGSLGGPVKKDKLLFFGNYEGFREASTGNPPVGRVFTANERNGIFTDPILDPFANNAPFANNTVPQNRIDPISRRILELHPLPNNPSDPARNFIFNDVPSGRINRDYAVGRMDYNLNSNNTIFGRYLFNQEKLRTSPTLPAPANSGGRDFILKAQTVSLHYNRVFTPTLVNNFTVGYTRYRNRLGTLNSFVRDFVTPSGITNTLSAVDPLFWAVPAITVPGYLTTNEITGNYRTMNTYQIQESLLWQKGRHNIKIGGDTRMIKTYMFYTGGNGGTAFGNYYTNQGRTLLASGVADFLLGYASQANKTARATQWNSTIKYVGAFIQDDWKVTSKLTLNLGFRYEVESALKQIDNGGLGWHVQDRVMLVSKLATNLPAIQDFYKTIRPEIGLRIVDNRAPYNADTNNLQPRFGFAYSLAKNTVLRGGYAIFFDSPQIQSLASTNDFAPNTLRPIWTAAPAPGLPTFGYNPEGATSAERALLTAPLTIFPFISRNFPYAKIQQWNLTIQQQLTKSLVFEVQYHGARGVSLLGFDNINFRAPGPGNVQQLLPMPYFARIQNEDMWGMSKFHGLGWKLEQRPWHGLTYLASFTYSKSIDNSSTFNQGPQWVDPFDRNTGFGPSDFNVPLRYTTAFEYALPVGKGKKFEFNGAADKVLGGWGIRGIAQFMSGLPTNPGMALSRTGICATSCSARPDRVGNGNLPSGERTIQRWFDVSAFRLLAAGGADRRVGNAGRNILRQPGVNQWDLQIYKDTKLFETHSLEFRWEMLNAFNHTQWGGANANAETPTQFGIITSTRPPRIMQLVLRYSF